MIVFADKGFAKPQMFLNLFVSNAGLLVIACGLTIVMITGGIDISVGSVTALVCMVLADLMENKGVNAYAAVLVALLIGVAFGIVQGFLVAYLDIQPFIVTLAGMFFGRGLMENKPVNNRVQTGKYPPKTPKIGKTRKIRLTK